LVESNIVTGWDDPRMPTITAMRRRGYPAQALKNFVRRAGVSKRDQRIDLSALESCVREELNKTAHRVMAVLDPLKVIITNYPEGKIENLPVENNQEDENAGERLVPFAREIYIEREDFAIEAHKKWNRMAPSQDVRLKGAYILHCTGYQTDETGQVSEVYCTYYENSKSGSDNSGIKPKGTLHWVSIAHAIPTEVRLYDRLFTDPIPDGHEDKNFKEFLNPDALHVVTAYLEPSLKTAAVGTSFQFIRLGYFCVDLDSKTDKLVFNRTVALKESKPF
jgi:glutaminyl-tRNA synthetase